MTTFLLPPPPHSRCIIVTRPQHLCSCPGGRPINVSNAPRTGLVATNTAKKISQQQQCGCNQCPTVYSLMDHPCEGAGIVRSHRSGQLQEPAHRLSHAPAQSQTRWSRFDVCGIQHTAVVGGVARCFLRTPRPPSSPHSHCGTPPWAFSPFRNLHSPCNCGQPRSTVMKDQLPQQKETVFAEV